MIHSSLKINIILFIKRIFGYDLIDKFLQKYYLRTYKTSDIIFIHIPKAAGTSISNILYGKRNGHLTASFIKNKLKKGYAQKYSFSVCRNPYSRLLSAYNFAIQGSTNEGAVANPNFYKQKIFSTFEGFLKNWLINQELSNIDPIFIPQHLFVFDNEELLVNKIFKLENISEVEKILSRLLNKEVILDNKNVSKKLISSTDYNDELRNIVYKLYKKDFELFGYEK